MSKPWQTKEWQEKRAEFIKDKCCSWCGSRRYLTIDHLKPSNSQTEEDYYAFKDTIILCRRCAFARLKGMHLCPQCKKKYVRSRFNVCFDCLPSERKEGIKARKEEAMKEAIEMEKEEEYETRIDYCGNCEHHIEDEGQELFCGLSPDIMCDHGLTEDTGLRRNIGNEQKRGNEA